MKTPQSWDERKDIIVPGEEKTTLAFCIQHLLQAYEKAIVEHGGFFIALSGGSTPKAIFEHLTASPYKEKIDWKKVHLFWGDERSVGPEDSENNYRMAMKAGFEKMGIPEEQIHRMRAEKNIEEEALHYEKILQSQIGNRGFDYLCLGMGEDGHTASLFPGTRALDVKDRLVVANHVPQKNTWRMTLTYSCINAAKNIVLYVLGDSKKEKILEIFSTKELLYPVQQVGSEESKALWILDDRAASLLFPKSSLDSK